MHIDILHAEDCLQRIRWTRRQHDLEQSIRILCGRDQQQLILHIFGPTQLALHLTRPTMTLGTKDAGITSVSTLTGASATAKTAAMGLRVFRVGF